VLGIAPIERLGPVNNRDINEALKGFYDGTDRLDLNWI
jgi:hypothetical protein